jgi:hypothetical protein
MFRMILTKRGAKAAGNLYDVFTDYETLPDVTWAEAIAYNTMADITTGTLDGTETADAEERQLVAGTRKVWARIQEANKRNRANAPTPIIDHAAIAAEMVKLLPAPLTLEEIGGEVVRQLKLPGN